MPSNIAAVPLANAKRKHRKDEDEEDESDDAESDVSMVNVDFDFYNPNPEVDDIALKRLLNQLFTSDAQLFDVHALATLILGCAKEYGVGSCVKVDGEESDPYAYLSVVDIAGKAADPALQTLLSYLVGSFPKQPTASPLRDLISSASTPSSSSSPAPPSTPRIALVVSERLVNLPVQLVPPMYDMLLTELDAAVAEGNPALEFTHFLLLGRVYSMDGMDDVNVGFAEVESKKSKKAKREAAAAAAAGGAGVPTSGTFYYHPEEEFLEKVALHTHTYPFKTQQPRDAESFGVEQRGRLLLVEKAKMREGIRLMQEAIS